MTTVAVVRNVLAANDRLAAENRRLLDDAGVFAVNVMASPGAGKTTLILASAAALKGRLKVGVIEGDLATSIDAERVAAAGLPVVQINTEGGCHLDASMVRQALAVLPLSEIDVLFIENVGNLVCPANFALGAHVNTGRVTLVLGSTPEGDDKPAKYPGIYAGADVVVINKADLAAVLDFDEGNFVRGVRAVNRRAPLFALSSRSGAGVGEWADWLCDAAAAQIGQQHEALHGRG